MKLISWNVNGIRALERKQELGILDKSKYDILCFQETKVWDTSALSKDLLEKDGYHSYWNCAKKRKGYSGVAVYTKEKPLEVITDFGDSILSKEGRMIRLDYKDFVLLNVYFPNGKARQERLDYKMEFYREFLKYIKKLDKQSKNVVFCGDVNTAHKEIDLARPKANEKISGFLPIERKWIDKVIEAGFIDTLRELHKEAELYTWWDVKSRARERNVGWRIDYFFINKSFRKHFKYAFILPDVTGSDHCPVGIELA